MPWILDHGLQCRSSRLHDPSFVEIGHRDLIDKRKARVVEVAPGGTLSDYVPFYFTPKSPMLYNIKTGYNGIRPRAMSEIAIFVASIRDLHAAGITLLMTDRHDYLSTAVFSSDLRGLDLIPWEQLRTCDFERPMEDPGKMERYQAEALIFRELPVSRLRGIITFDETSRRTIDDELHRLSISLKVGAKPERYF